MGTSPGHVPWRWAILVAGLAAGAVSTWWHSDSAWPLILAGRIATFVGLLLVTAPLCISVGRKISQLDDAVASLVGSRLRRPSGALTRALGALISGLFVLSAGATTIDALGDDPAAIERAYTADGYNVVEVRRPSEEVRSILRRYDVVSGAPSNDSEIMGTLSGRCETIGRVTGDQIECTKRTLFGVTYEGQSAPTKYKATPVSLMGPRAETLSGFVVHVTTQASLRETDQTVLIPLPVDQAYRLYDQLVGADAVTNVRMGGTATVSGASELSAILDVFRWGAAFAVIMSMVATLVSLVSLSYDRQPANNYLQIIGVTPRKAAAAVVLEIMSAAGASLALGVFSSWLWAIAIQSPERPMSLVPVILPFIVCFLP